MGRASVSDDMQYAGGVASEHARGLGDGDVFVVVLRHAADDSLRDRAEFSGGGVVDDDFVVRSAFRGEVGGASRLSG